VKPYPGNHAGYLFHRSNRSVYDNWKISLKRMRIGSKLADWYRRKNHRCRYACRWTLIVLRTTLFIGILPS
jgi:hypothetical protein